jgi:HEAT repeat protein
LVDIGAPAVGPLAAALKHEDWLVRYYATNALGRIKDVRAVEPLIAALSDARWEVRQNISEALGEFKDARAVEPLAVALKDREWEVRQNAAKALGQIKDARAVEPLIAALQDESWNVRDHAARALGQIKDARAVEPLGAALNDLGLSAVTALGAIKDVRAVEPLVGALTDWDLAPPVARVLESLGWEPATSEDRVHYLAARRDKTGLLSQWERSRDVLRADILSDDQSRFNNAILAFIWLGRDETVSDLIAALDSRGNREIAEAYVNCGQKELQEAAQHWARHNGFVIAASGGQARIEWSGP